MNLFALIAAACLGAQGPQEFNMEQLNRLVELRQSVEAVQQLEEHGYAPGDKDKILKNIYTEAAKVANVQTMDYKILKSITGHAQSPWQKFTGFFTFVNILYVTGAILGVSAITWLFGIYILCLLLWIPKEGWELLCYGACIGLIFLGAKMSPEWYLLPVLPGCLGLIGCLTFTRFAHFDGLETIFKGRPRHADNGFNQLQAWILTITWAAVAVHFGSHIIGFMTIAALMTAVGFIVGAIPGVVYMGWDKDDYVARSTITAGGILALYILSSITGNIKFEIFREGMAFFGTLVYFLGILIMSSKWWGDSYHRFGPFYWFMQVVCVASGVAAIWLGSVFGLGMLLGIGGTLFYLYIIEKYYELPWEGSGWAWSLLGLAGILYGFAAFAQAHPQYFIFMFK
jgi:hypothetical protein